ncbi:alpha-2,3-sialyltransferase [Friedmanniella luteola]|nr:alpha-2,3-sialyltransferase [Friedmanniella luteola]
MRTASLTEQPGEREIASFAPLVHRPLVIAGNGPSAAVPPQHRLPADPVVFRMNWFFLESHYHFGSHVDAWFFSVPNQTLEETLAQEIRSGRYTVDRLLSPMQLPSGRDGDGWGNQLLDVDVVQQDHWAVVARHPRLARRFMSRPGLPTTGLQALGFALAVGFREVYLSGIDLYESAEARYGYTVTDQVAAALTAKDITPGYESAHSIDTDLAFLQACLTEFPDARVHNLSESVNLSVYLGTAPEQVEGPDLAAGSTAHLGEPKDRVVATLAGAPGADPVVVTAPRDRRLWQEVDGRRCAYVTVVSGNYHHGARALAGSLRRVSDVPLLALATADADRVALAASDIHVIDVPEIRNPNTSQRFQQRFQHTYTKLNVFRLDFLDRLVYLDSDTVVRKNIDELFAGHGFAAAPDSGFDRASSREFNSGVLALEPSHAQFCRMLDALAATPSRDGGDQGFLNSFLDTWEALPVEYNTTKRVFAHHPALYTDADVKVLHYVGNKPWDPLRDPAHDRYAELDRDWLDCLEAWELRELVTDLRAVASAQAREDAGLQVSGGSSLSPFRQAQKLNAKRRFAQAEEVLRDAWRTKEATPAELRELARALRAQGRHSEAVATLRTAARLAPESMAVTRELQAARARAVVQTLRRLNAKVVGRG